MFKTGEEYIDRQIKAIEADIKEGRLAQAALVYEDIVSHIKSMHRRKTNKVFYLPAKYSTISKQARDLYKQMVKKAK